MPLIPVPSTGQFTASQIKAAFPNLPNAAYLSSYRGVMPGTLNTGSLALSSLRGKVAPSPTYTAANINSTGNNVTVTGTNAAFTVTINLGLGTIGHTLSLASYVDNASYQPGLTFAYTGTLPTGVTIGTDGTLTIANTVSSASNTNTTITVTNIYGQTSTFTLAFTIISIAPTSSSMGTERTAIYSNGSVSRTLSNYFTDTSGTTLTYTLTANPQGNASINASGVLTVGIANRGVQYTVTVKATNGYGQWVESSLTVYEMKYQQFNISTYVPNGFVTVYPINNGSFSLIFSLTMPMTGYYPQFSGSYGVYAYTGNINYTTLVLKTPTNVDSGIILRNITQGNSGMASNQTWNFMNPTNTSQNLVMNKSSSYSFHAVFNDPLPERVQVYMTGQIYYWGIPGQ